MTVFFGQFFGLIKQQKNEELKDEIWHRIFYAKTNKKILNRIWFKS